MGRILAAVGAAVSLAVLLAVGFVAVRADDGVSGRSVGEFGSVAPDPATAGGGAAAPQGEARDSDGQPVTDSEAAGPEAVENEAASAGELPASRIPVPAPVSQVPVRSGSLASLQAPPPPAPVGLRIGSVSIDAPVEPVGYDAGRGEMEVPRSRELVGWYRHGPLPGGAGSAVLAAHVDWNGRAGAFYDLANVEPGTRIVVEFAADGTERHFRAEALRQYSKDELPVDQLFAKDGPAVLTLITCGGDFDAGDRSYRDNVVVRAVELDLDSDPVAG